MSRALRDLCPLIRAKADRLIAGCADRKVYLIILDTIRTPEEQERYLATGRSRTANSLHLPQEKCSVCHGLSHAMDAAPILSLDLGRVTAIEWDSTAWTWAVYVDEAEKAGLECGAKWRKFPDWSHVQLPKT